VVLEYPREQTRAADESWIGTWEEHFDSAAPIGDRTERNRPFVHLNQPAISETDSDSRKEPQFLVGLNATEQAQAICAIALKFLAAKSCTRFGILFPRAGALARLVSEFLTRSGISASRRYRAPDTGRVRGAVVGMHGSIYKRTINSSRSFDSWKRTQIPWTGYRSTRSGKNLRWVYRQILIDDINLLHEYCARQTENEKLVRIAKLLRFNRVSPVQGDAGPVSLRNEDDLFQVEMGQSLD